MLERLYVDNYRCLVNFECHFQRQQLILGPNGGGKTTLLQVLSSLRDFCVNGTPADGLFIGLTRTRWQDAREQTFELDVAGNDGHYTFKLVMDAWGTPVTRPRIVKEEVCFSGEPVFRFNLGEVQLFNDRYEEKVQYPFDWHRSALATITERPENQKLIWFKHWLGALYCSSPDPRQMATLADREAPAPTFNMSNFAAWYRHLRLESDDHELVEDLREALPGFVSMDLKDAGVGNRFLMLTFAAQGNNGKPNHYTAAFAELSDGQRVLIGLYTALHYILKHGGTVFFDEPDNFVALREITPWLEKALAVVEESGRGQIVIISHHPELLNRLATTDGLLLDRPAGRHTRVRAFADAARTGLSPAELVARGWEDE